ncbi:uncharacterized protein ACOB8E_011592 isoform 1-T1 [Sarcophilus harrisii]
MTILGLELEPDFLLFFNFRGAEFIQTSHQTSVAGTFFGFSLKNWSNPLSESTEVLLLICKEYEINLSRGCREVVGFPLSSEDTLLFWFVNTLVLGRKGEFKVKDGYGAAALRLPENSQPGLCSCCLYDPVVSFPYGYFCLELPQAPGSLV